MSCRVPRHSQGDANEWDDVAIPHASHQGGTSDFIPSLLDTVSPVKLII